jgi:hypothetical protein
MSDDLTITNNTTLYNPEGSKGVTVTTSGAKEALDVNLTNSDLVPNTGLYISRHLQNGGANDLAVDGSSTPVVFSRGPGTGKKWFIYRIIWTIQDVGMNWQKFGGLSSLTNGVDLDYDTFGVNLDLFDGVAIKANNGFVHYCYDAEINPGTVDVLRVRWTFNKGGTALEMNNADGDTMNFTINDNLTGLTDFFAIVQGYEVDE